MYTGGDGKMQVSMVDILQSLLRKIACFYSIKFSSRADSNISYKLSAQLQMLAVQTMGKYRLHELSQPNLFRDSNNIYNFVFGVF